MDHSNGASCSLNAVDLEERKKAWREVSSRAISREVADGRITSVYPSDPHLLQTVKGLIAAEATCCSFLSFTVQEEEDRTIVELAFPESARSLVEGAIASPQPAPSPAT